MTHHRTAIAAIVASATLSALTAVSLAPALAADIIEAPIIHAPVVDEVKAFGGWYIRGDFGYAFVDEDDDFVRNGVDKNKDGSPIFSDSHVDDLFSLGVGVGAHMNQFLRTDITADYFFEGDFEASGTDTCGGIDINTGGCASVSSTTSTDLDVLTFLANLYVDAGTYAGITPYVGAGVGFAYVDYGDVTDDITQPDGSSLTSTLDGDSDLRLAWALSAGASYDVSDQFAIDAGYRYTSIEEGSISKALDLDDDGFDLHQLRIGARYKLH